MNVSIIICTYNRSASLRRTLESLCACQIPQGLDWELVLVDNRSTDATKTTCEEFRNSLPIKYVYEPQQGKSRALNLGLREASGDLLLFTDDDVSVDPAWISSYVSAALRHPDVDLFGGRIIPEWEKKPPQWLSGQANGNLFNEVSVRYDLGSEETVYTSMETPFYGANMAMRKRTFESGLRFREDLGLKGSDSTRGEDTEIINQALGMGCKAAYLPGSVVRHWNSASRATHRYLIEWYMGMGRRDVRLGIYPTSLRTWFGAPGYLWKLFFIHSSRLILTRWTAPLDTWVKTETKAARYWGAITEHREMNSKELNENKTM